MTSPESRTATLRRWITPRSVTAAIGVAVLIAAVLSVKVVSIEDDQAGAPERFDAVAFADKNYPNVIEPYIAENAVDLAMLVAELANGTDPGEFGNSSGAGNAHAFPVIFTAVAGTATPPVLPVNIEGIPDDVTVVVQIGPALSGTAIRDVTGELSFDQFTNQLEYQNVGTELNNQIRGSVLESLDAAALTGKTIVVTGAILWGNPAFVSVIPTSIEVQP